MITNVWTKSSYSTAGGSCVEVRHAQDGNIQVRDSENPNSQFLTLPPPSGASSSPGAKCDEFNL